MSNPFVRTAFFFILDSNDDMYMVMSNDVVKTSSEMDPLNGIKLSISVVGNGISNSPAVVLADSGPFEASQFYFAHVPSRVSPPSLSPACSTTGQINCDWHPHITHTVLFP